MKGKIILPLVLALLGLGAGACSTVGAPDDAREEAKCIGVDQALSNIRSAEGAVVSVCGFFKYEFEDKNLYATERAAMDQSNQHCLAVGKGNELASDLAAWTGRRVRVSGVATANFCPSGTLCPAACSNSGIFVRTIEAVK